MYITTLQRVAYHNCYNTYFLVEIYMLHRKKPIMIPMLRVWPVWRGKLLQCVHVVVLRYSTHSLPNWQWTACQSAYSKKHSTKTFMLHVWSDILAETWRTTLQSLPLTDFSAAFDHIILAKHPRPALQRLSCSGSSLSWRVYNGQLSAIHQTVLCGVRFVISQATRQISISFSIYHIGKHWK